MGRMLTFLLGLAALGYASYWYISHGSMHTTDGEPPTAELQRVREKTHVIEQKMQKQFDDNTAKTSQAEDH